MFKDIIFNEYNDVFTGIGKLKNFKAELHIDENITPKIQQYRRIPLPIRDKVEAELTRLENAAVIEKVYGPTEWISPICSSI